MMPAARFHSGHKEGTEDCRRFYDRRFYSRDLEPLGALFDRLF